MLTQDQKEAILRAAGVEIPQRGSGSQAQQQTQDDQNTGSEAQADGRAQTAKTYALAIEALFDRYVEQRALHSLREGGGSLPQGPRSHVS